MSPRPVQESLLIILGARLARVEAYLGLTEDSDGEAPQIHAYDEYVGKYLPPFLNACEKLGGHVLELGWARKKAFTGQRSFLLMASQCKRPDGLFEFVRAAQALGWLCAERTPKKKKTTVDSFVEGLDFWGNKIRLAQYIRNYHLVGVTWNNKGRDVTNYTPDIAKSGTPASGGMVNVFAGIKSIDQSGGKTAGLKKVTKDMQTWRKDYQPDGAAPVAATAATKKPAAPVKVAKPAVCEERNGNWQIEYQTGPEPLTVSGISMKQQVYIFGCEGATILLEGKAKNIVFDSCKKTKLIFDNAVSSIETDGCLVYISWEGREVQFVTSKSSEMNVAFPQGAGSDDYAEKPIPEQVVHKIMDNLTISSDVSALYSK
ncbi:Adenylate cyclase associated (CAP) C terminal [Phytophthora infestans]|uniref:Adenylate cyclase associated (CAP) C terminal n=1 Tax=Phytophthora infestans TaxID=4787 RepID=A0A8S9UTI4_PHYIN|nr:Adenylate cyclase associated (CAP) C terminal [Phytophthora infestans]